MMKRLLVLIACLGLTAHLSGCTSHDAKQDSEVTSDYDSSELEKVEGSDEVEVLKTTYHQKLETAILYR